MRHDPSLMNLMLRLVPSLPRPRPRLFLANTPLTLRQSPILVPGVRLVGRLTSTKNVPRVSRRWSTIQVMSSCHVS